MVYGRLDITCPTCSNRFSIKQSRRKDKNFCSMKCFYIHRNPEYGVKHLCLLCEKEIGDYRVKRKYCSSGCTILHQKQLRYKQIESGDPSLYVKNYRNYLIEKYGAACMECGWSKTNKYSNTVPIELEHVDGNSENNNLDNLKLLCPNCHSLTPTFRGLNRGNGRHERMSRYNEGKSY